MAKQIDKSLQRFLDYVRIDTQSNEDSFSVPSEAKELNLSRKIMEDLKELGIDSHLDEYGIVYGKLKGEEGLDPIGLNSHVDTALEISGKDVKPQIIENYDGGYIKLNEEYKMSPKEFPTLGNHIGDDLVVTSGDTLLGADDKAGIAIIMAVLEYYATHKEVKHHTICFCFTPDEEIGRGPDHFDAKEFGAKYAYTVDGGVYNEVAYETFNAANATVKISGVSIHPGEAKGKLVNASTVAFAFDAALPREKRPEFTEGYEGFNHLVSVQGQVDHAEMHYILRNHDASKLEEQKEEFRLAKEKVLSLFPKASVDIEIKDSYRNMKEVIDANPIVMEKVQKAFQTLGFELVSNPIRGGTDGATFSFKGCPTPNLGTGSYNHHGRFEYLSIGEFNKMIEIVKEIVKA